MPMTSGDPRTSRIVIFTADIRVSEGDIREAGDDLAQAVQNRIGLTGAQVINVEESRPALP